MITPIIGEMDDPAAIELLRSHFHALFEQPTPRQVLVNLEYVHHLNAQAIGVLLAHHLRLDRCWRRLANLPAACASHGRVASSQADDAGRMPSHP